MGHACPVDAKNGAHNTFVPAALATGSVQLLYGAQATRILRRGDRAVGVVLALAEGDRVIEVACDRVVVAAGAIETPRLLLASGIGNDHVGRHLHGHTKCLVVGVLPHRVPTFRGPGHSIATMDFVHDGSGHPGGGVLFDAFAPYPLQLMAWGDALGAPRWGRGRTEWLGAAVGHIAGAMTMGQEIPVAASRVTLDHARMDRHGVPAVRLHRAVHEASVANLDHLRARCAEWVLEAGAVRVVDVFAHSADRVSPATEHSAGTVRMGDDPGASAADRFGLVHGTGNVTVCDASLHPTNGSVNPTLTIIANAHRVATHLAKG
jgi:choline dehydrogenase-like flavoprotein